MVRSREATPLSRAGRVRELQPEVRPGETSREGPQVTPAKVRGPRDLVAAERRVLRTALAALAVRDEYEALMDKMRNVGRLWTRKEDSAWRRLLTKDSRSGQAHREAVTAYRSVSRKRRAR